MLKICCNMIKKEKDPIFERVQRAKNGENRKVTNPKFFLTEIAFKIIACYVVEPEAKISRYHNTWLQVSVLRNECFK